LANMSLMTDPSVMEDSGIIGLVSSNQVETPSFIYADWKLTKAVDLLRCAINSKAVKILYSLKPFNIADALRTMAKSVDGFSVSSLFEAHLSRQILSQEGQVHFVTPGIRVAEMRELMNLCDRFTINSVSQWRRFGCQLAEEVECGLRINPDVSFTDDPRYDPCRPNSKLGVSLKDLLITISGEPEFFDGLKGLHLHNNCVSSDWSHLLETVLHIDERIAIFLRKLEWVNLGGGYEFSESTDFDPLNEAIDLLSSKYGLEVIVEPGSALVNSACYIVSSVIDIFKSDGKMIALLDTTVNHMPEVFEYQFEPDVVGHVEGGRYEYILAGCSCLPGDLFGEYAFERQLEIGQRIVFENVGAYSLVKANMFNGINLPTIYAATQSGELVLKKQFTYEDFASRCGVKAHATARARA